MEKTLNPRQAIPVLGSTGRWPVVRGSLPRTAAGLASGEVLAFGFAVSGKGASGRLPNATGWQPVLPRMRT
jgi:hypothetical protein